MPFNLGMGEVLVILIVALLVFGGRLPQVGRSLGRGILEFKEGLSGKPGPEEEDDEDEDDDEDEEAEEPEEVETKTGGNGTSG